MIYQVPSFQILKHKNVFFGKGSYFLGDIHQFFKYDPDVTPSALSNHTEFTLHVRKGKRSLTVILLFKWRMITYQEDSGMLS